LPANRSVWEPLMSARNFCWIVSFSFFVMLGAAGPLAAEESEPVVVNVLTYSARGGGRGQCSPVTVRADSSSDGTARVGFFESEVGGTGDQWRSAGWMAAVTAAMLTDFDPRAMRV